MLAVRLGSYSMCATLAGTPSLSARRKSITRYARLWPPPLCRVVILPCTLRPPVLCSGRISDFSGVDRVISAKSETLEPRRPGVVGLCLRMPMVSPPSARRSAEDLDRTALLGEGHDRALRVLALAVAAPGALALARPVQRVDADDLDAEHLLHGDLDLGLVGGRRHQEGVLALLEQPVALLGDHRRDQYVARIGDHLLSSVTSPASLDRAMARAERPRAGPARNVSSASAVKITSSLTSTSYVFSWSGAITCTAGRLRRLRHASSSSRPTTTSTRGRSLSAAIAVRAVLVDGFDPETIPVSTCTRPLRARSDSAPRRAACFIFLGVFWA